MPGFFADFDFWCPNFSRPRWSFDRDIAAWIMGGSGGGGAGWRAHKGRGWRPRGGRMFEQGDLKYVILQLLDEKPRHGYEIIKELEERCAGFYAPSAGTVYPTLQLLEDLGYASGATEEGGKKVYSITDEGRRYLATHKSRVDDIFERLADIGSTILSDAMSDVHRAFKDVARATYASGSRYYRDRDLVDDVAEILAKASREVEEAIRRAADRKPSQEDEEEEKGASRPAESSEGEQPGRGKT